MKSSLVGFPLSDERERDDAMPHHTLYDQCVTHTRTVWYLRICVRLRLASSFIVHNKHNRTEITHDFISIDDSLLFAF